MTCPHCLRALQFVVHREYTDKCEGCTYRALAYMKEPERESALRKLQHLRNADDANYVKGKVFEEMARIAALSAACPRRERA